jgi:hypothetical protein
MKGNEKRGKQKGKAGKEKGKRKGKDAEARKGTDPEFLIGALPTWLFELLTSYERKKIRKEKMKTKKMVVLEAGILPLEGDPLENFCSFFFFFFFFFVFVSESRENKNSREGKKEMKK